MGLFAAYSNERVYVAFGSQKIVLRASDTIDARARSRAISACRSRTSR
ncbi:MAG: hypothetical protein ACLTG4_03960 [Oscillospiraceae bacterium]